MLNYIPFPAQYNHPQGLSLKCTRQVAQTDPGRPNHRRLPFREVCKATLIPGVQFRKQDLCAVDQLVDYWELHRGSFSHHACREPADFSYLLEGRRFQKIPHSC